MGCAQRPLPTRVWQNYGPTCKPCYCSAHSGSRWVICSSNGWNAVRAERVRLVSIRGSNGNNHTLSTYFCHPTARAIRHRQKGLEGLLALSVECHLACLSADYLGNAGLFHGQGLQHKWTSTGLCPV